MVPFGTLLYILVPFATYWYILVTIVGFGTFSKWCLSVRFGNFSRFWYLYYLFHFWYMYASSFDEFFICVRSSLMPINMKTNQSPEVCRQVQKNFPRLYPTKWTPITNFHPRCNLITYPHPTRPPVRKPIHAGACLTLRPTLTRRPAARRSN